MKPARSAFDFLSLGLYAFCALEIEFIMLYLIEPFLFPSLTDMTLYCCLHWGLCALFGAIAAVALLWVAKKHYQFSLLDARENPPRKAVVAAVVLCLLGTGYNYLGCGDLLLVYKLRHLNAPEFVFQYLWLFCQAALFLLLIAFGQKAGEMKRGDRIMPWGGFLTGALWGLFQLLIRQDLLLGILSCVMGVLYGLVYLLVRKNMRWAYPMMVVMLCI